MTQDEGSEQPGYAGPPPTPYSAPQPYPAGPPQQQYPPAPPNPAPYRGGQAYPSPYAQPHPGSQPYPGAPGAQPYPSPYPGAQPYPPGYAAQPPYPGAPVQPATNGPAPRRRMLIMGLAAVVAVVVIVGVVLVFALRSTALSHTAVEQQLKQTYGTTVTCNNGNDIDLDHTGQTFTCQGSGASFTITVDNTDNGTYSVTSHTAG